MTESHVLAARSIARQRLFAVLTYALAVLLVPVAALRSPGHPLRVAANWALALRFPTESLHGLTPRTRQALEAARSEALWRHGVLIGVTSGYRDLDQQRLLFRREVHRTGSAWAARPRVLPPDESAHVRGIAVDVRPPAGAHWLDRHGGKHGLYRMYDNEWWHFEYHPDVRPRRLPSPRFSCARPGHPVSETAGQVSG